MPVSQDTCPYSDLAGFENIYLEDSYVLAFQMGISEAKFWVDAVLLENHPLWRPRAPDEAYSYQRILLTFPGVRETTWHELVVRPTIGPEGEADFGNIDTFVFNDDTYHLVGEWGNITITSDRPTVRPLRADESFGTPPR